MPINVQLEDERGNALATLDTPPWATNWILLCADLDGTACLRFIDPYGDTVFNRAQMRVLADELAEVGRVLTDEGVERAYQRWLSPFLTMEAGIREEALRCPKPSRSALLGHIESLRAFAEAGARTAHQFLRFMGD